MVKKTEAGLIAKRRAETTDKDSSINTSLERRYIWTAHSKLQKKLKTTPTRRECVQKLHKGTRAYVKVEISLRNTGKRGKNARVFSKM